MSFNYSILQTWHKFQRYLPGTGNEGTECHGCGDAREGVGRPEVAVGREGAAGPCKANIAHAITQQCLNLELLCDPVSSQKCVVKSV